MFFVTEKLHCNDAHCTLSAQQHFKKKIGFLIFFFCNKQLPLVYTLQYCTLFFLAGVNTFVFSSNLIDSVHNEPFTYLPTSTAVLRGCVREKVQH